MSTNDKNATSCGSELSDGLGLAPERAEWEHLMAYGYAPGNYMSRCHRCEQVVPGLDKRAITCLPCAQRRHAERTAAFDALRA